MNWFEVVVSFILLIVTCLGILKLRAVELEQRQEEKRLRKEFEKHGIKWE